MIEIIRLLHRSSRLVNSDDNLPSLAFADEVANYNGAVCSHYAPNSNPVVTSEVDLILLQNGGYPSLLSFDRASAWLPRMKLLCGHREAELRGGYCGNTNEVVVSCLCDDCNQRIEQMPRFLPHADKWARLMTLEVHH